MGDEEKDKLEVPEHPLPPVDPGKPDAEPQDGEDPGVPEDPGKSGEPHP